MERAMERFRKGPTSRPKLLRRSAVIAGGSMAAWELLEWLTHDRVAHASSCIRPDLSIQDLASQRYTPVDDTAVNGCSRKARPPQKFVRCASGALP
jgi:hypothetical protein